MIPFHIVDTSSAGIGLSMKMGLEKGEDHKRKATAKCPITGASIPSTSFHRRHSRYTLCCQRTLRRCVCHLEKTQQSTQLRLRMSIENYWRRGSVGYLCFRSVWTHFPVSIFHKRIVLSKEALRNQKAERVGVRVMTNGKAYLASSFPSGLQAMV